MKKQFISYIAGGTFVLAATAGLALAFTPQRAQAATITTTCNNTGTDAATLTTAINASSAGDEIVIEGTCLITSTVKLKGDRSYRGNSQSATVLKQGNSANLAAVLAADSYLDNTAYSGAPISIRNLTVDGNAANNTAATNGIIVRSWQTTIDSVRIKDVDNDGILLSEVAANGTTHFTAGSTMVNGTISNSMIDNAGGHGVNVADTGNVITDWTLSGNWIGYVAHDAIHLDNAAGWMIHNNHIYGVKETAVYANRMFGTSISDNYIEDFGGTTTAGTYYGINVTMQGDVASTISGNRVFGYNVNEANVGSTYRYIGVTNVNYGSAYLAVTDNTIKGANTNRGTGLYYSRGGGSNTLTVVTNSNQVSNVYSGQQRFQGVGVTFAGSF